MMWRRLSRGASVAGGNENDKGLLPPLPLTCGQPRSEALLKIGREARGREGGRREGPALEQGRFCRGLRKGSG